MTDEARRKAGREYYARNRDKILAQKKKYHKANPEKWRARNKAWKAANPAHFLLLSARQNARRRGQECELTIEQVIELLKPMKCSMTGMTLLWEGGPWALSIDRLRNEEGYHKDNVRLVSWAYNSMRGEWTDEIVLTMAQSLVTAASNKAESQHKYFSRVSSFGYVTSKARK